MPNFNTTLGIRSEGESVILDTRPDHEVAPGLIHFAVLATLAEVSAAQAVAESVVPATVSLHLLRPASPGRLTARGRVLKKGRRLATAEGEVFQEDNLIAKAVVSFAILGGLKT